MKKEYGIMSLTVRNIENNEFFQLLSESKDEFLGVQKPISLSRFMQQSLGIWRNFLRLCKLVCTVPRPVKRWLVWKRLIVSVMMRFLL